MQVVNVGEREILLSLLSKINGPNLTVSGMSLAELAEKSGWRDLARLLRSRK